MDFTGPLYVKQGSVKESYVALFTWAVHLDLVTDQSTGSFMLALKIYLKKRFVESDLFRQYRNLQMRSAGFEGAMEEH